MPGRPTPLPEQFTQDFYPDIWEKGGGVGFFNLMEGYWIAGIIGVLLFAFAYGVLLQYLYRMFIRNSNSVAACVWYAMFINAAVLTAIRSGMLMTLKAALMASIPFVFALALPNAPIF
jgi:oligosaccharide repeat unit polymerase